MPSSLLSTEVQSALELQGIGVQTYIAALNCSAPLLDTLRQIGGEENLVELKAVEDAVRVAKTSDHYVIIAQVSSVMPILQAIGSEVASTIAVIAVGRPKEDDPSAAMLRSSGAMTVVENPSVSELEPILRRAEEFRALRALELAHRCEARRLKRREMNLLGHPPETMTDDLSTFQPPPLPVGPISTYNLEASSEAFERAYIDRVQMLCESAREAAKHLEVSAATLARRLRKEASNG